MQDRVTGLTPTAPEASTHPIIRDQMREREEAVEKEKVYE